MNIRAQILKEHSKENAEAIADWIGTNKSRLEKLIDIFLHDEYRVVQRAAFVISKIDDKHPELLTPYLDSMVTRMKEPNLHVAVKRNVLRILQNKHIPEHLHGDIMNICFDSLANVQEPIAIRVFSMTVLDNLSKQYPEIKQELNAIIEEELQRGASAGFISRAKKILKSR